MRHMVLLLFLMAVSFSQVWGAPLRITAPPVAESLALAVLADREAVPGSPAIAFIPWHSPDQARALVAGGRVDAAVITTATAAVFHARGVLVRIAGMFNTPLWVVSAWDAARPGSLRGTLLFPFGHREMPELLFDAVFGSQHQGLVTRHTGGALEAVNLLLAGRADHALLAEPAAGMAVARSAAMKSGPNLVRHRDFRQIWANKFKGRPLYVSALAVFGETARKEGLVKQVLLAYGKAAEWIRQHPKLAGKIARERFPALAAQARDSRLPVPGGDLAWGEAAFEPAFFLLRKIHEQSPDAVGGKPPVRRIFMGVE